MTGLVAITTTWGAEHGGVNTFNLDLLEAMAAIVESPIGCVVLRIHPASGISRI